MRIGVSFNPHWVNGSPAWDIRLINGDIHRSVTFQSVRKAAARHVDCVRQCDIDSYARKALKVTKEPS